jgi:outer membrane protein OmpA-like peptidoglycan-associated protein
VYARVDARFLEVPNTSKNGVSPDWEFMGGIGLSFGGTPAAPPPPPPPPPPPVNGDRDKDGIPDASDKCPTEPETINNVKDDDGCPDKGIVVLKEGELETLTPIFFASDRARVRHAFRPALNDIAAILISHPEIGRCAVEGHTDARGPTDWNKKLSFERAKSVAAYLIAKGVDPARVVAIGQGDALPWATNQTEAGRAANRRVIFHIEGVSEDQEQKQLELQKQRALKEHGTEAHTPPPAAPPPPEKKTP